MFKRPARPEVPTDTVVPLHFFDDTPLWRAFILYSMFVFDDVLDPTKLRDALQALVHRPGWQKLGARLGRDAKGGLVYHIPAAFSPERPAITYSHVTHHTKAADHPLASQIPRPTTESATVCDPDIFKPLFYPEDGPTNIDNYLNKDIPQLGLHIISFTDKTIVCLHWPHTLMDALGKRALLDAWVLMLQGRSDEVPTPIGADSDPLAEFGKHPTEPYDLEAQRLSMLGLARYGVGNIVNFTRAQENRMVCVPAAFVKQLRAKAMADLAAAPEDGVTFLSENDVLCAWWARLATLHLPRTSRRTVALNIALSLRSALAADLLPGADGLRAPRPYVSDAIGFVYVLLPMCELASAPLGRVAAAVRRGVVRAGSRSQVEAFAALWRASGPKLPPFFGAGDMHMVTFSNWTKARLYETDFSAALVTPGGDGRPIYIQNNQFGLTLPDGFPIIGKDNSGNYWMSGYMNKGNWAKVEEEMKKI